MTEVHGCAFLNPTLVKPKRSPRQVYEDSQLILDLSAICSSYRNKLCDTRALKFGSKSPYRTSSIAVVTFNSFI